MVLNGMAAFLYVIYQSEFGTFASLNNACKLSNCHHCTMDSKTNHALVNIRYQTDVILREQLLSLGCYHPFDLEVCRRQV